MSYTNKTWTRSVNVLRDIRHFSRNKSFVEMGAGLASTDPHLSESQNALSAREKTSAVLSTSERCTFPSDRPCEISDSVVN